MKGFRGFRGAVLIGVLGCWVDHPKHVLVYLFGK